MGLFGPGVEATLEETTELAWHVGLTTLGRGKVSILLTSLQCIPLLMTVPVNPVSIDVFGDTIH